MLTKFVHVASFTDDSEVIPDSARYGSLTQPAVPELVSMRLLTQFRNPHKCWLVSIHFEE